MDHKQNVYRMSEVSKRKVSYHTNATISRSPSPSSHLAAGQLSPCIPGKSNPNESRRDYTTETVPIQRRTHFLKDWSLEISACCIFILALIAIVITLRPHQNKPLPQWPYSISINSLLSIYSVILKVTILLVIAESLGKYLNRGELSAKHRKDTTFT